MEYAPSANLVIYDDTSGAAELIRTSPSYRAIPFAGGQPLEQEPAPIGYYRATTDQFPYLIHTGMTTSTGSRCLVMVALDIKPLQNDALKQIELFGGATAPPPLLHWGGESTLKARGRAVILVRQDERLRIYAGQIDPLRPSRFTSRYTLNDAEGLLAGELVTDRIVIGVQSGPLLGRISSD